VGDAAAVEARTGADRADAGAEAEAEKQAVFPSRATMAKAFRADIKALQKIQRLEDVLVLLNCVYIAMFGVNFCYAILTRGGHGVTAANAVLAVVALLPAVINLVIAAPLVVSRSTFTSFVVKLHTEVLGSVLEDQAVSDNLRKLVRERLRGSLESAWKAEADGGVDQNGRARRASVGGFANWETDGKQMIREVFDEIDDDHSGHLDREEFATMLEHLGVYLR
jgi:hypothetical protein